MKKLTRIMSTFLLIRKHNVYSAQVELLFGHVNYYQLEQEM